jgi:hypothetical protein
MSYFAPTSPSLSCDYGGGECLNRYTPPTAAKDARAVRWFAARGGIPNRRQPRGWKNNYQMIDVCPVHAKSA